VRVVPVLFALAIAASTLLMGANALAERPVAAKLLPDQTMVYVQARSMPDLIEAFRETSMGRITNDEKIKPLVAHLYGSILDAYTQVEERIGLGLAELLSLPQGELCIALVVQEQGNPEVVQCLVVLFSQAVARGRGLVKQAPGQAVVGLCYRISGFALGLAHRD